MGCRSSTGASGACCRTSRLIEHLPYTFIHNIQSPTVTAPLAAGQPRPGGWGTLPSPTRWSVVTATPWGCAGPFLLHGSVLPVCASPELPQLQEAGEWSHCCEGTGLPHCCRSLLSSVSQAAGSFLRNCPQGAITFPSH